MSDFYGKYNGHMWSHLVDCRKQFKDDQIVMLALTGSQNYNLDTPASDMDTKLTVLPSLEDIISNKPAVSTTHIREDKEHTDDDGSGRAAVYESTTVYRADPGLSVVFCSIFQPKSRDGSRYGYALRKAVDCDRSRSRW